MAYRILSFDGGGIRGQYVTTILRRIEEAFPGWSDAADLLAGTSIGAVLALGLAIGHKPDQLDELFRQHSPDLFQPPKARMPARIRRTIRAAYSSAPLKAILKEFCGDTRLANLARWVVIPAFKLDGGRSAGDNRCWKPVIFHNFRSGEHDYSRLTVSQVILRATATPTLFPSVEGYVDGGLVANNPSMVALAQLREAVARDKDPSVDQEVVLFSFGTGYVQRYIEQKRADWGLLQWQRYIVDLMNGGSIQLVDRQCRQLLRERYYRLCPTLPEKIEATEDGKRELLVEMAEAVDLSQTLAWLKEYWLDRQPSHIAG
jgi:patatin-like phospholipase/acyl hydrolase